MATTRNQLLAGTPKPHATAWQTGPKISACLPLGPPQTYNAAYADVAQLVEQHIRNVWVVSSNLIIGSKKSKG